MAGPWEKYAAPAASSKTPRSGVIFTDPYRAHDEQRKDTGLAIDQARLGVSQAAENRQQATLPYDVRKAAADATKAEIETQKVKEAAIEPWRKAAMDVMSSGEILKTIQDARGLINAGGSAGGWTRVSRIPVLGGIVEPQGVVDLRARLGTLASKTTLDKLAELKTLSSTGASGLGALSEKEAEFLRDSISSLDQGQSPAQLLDSLAQIELHYRRLQALSNNEDYRDPAIAKKYGIAPMPAKRDPSVVAGATPSDGGGSGGGAPGGPSAPAGAPPGDALAFAQGATRTEADPALAGVNNHIRGMIGAGRSAADIVGYMNAVQPGLGDQRAGDVAAAVKFRAQNPSVPMDRYAVSVENREVPMGTTRQLVNRAAQSPLGAYITSAGDAITAGTLDNLQDNPALARAGMKAIADANPASSLLGNLTGGALVGAGLEGAVGRAGAVAAPRIADMLYGAAYGAGSADEGSRLSGAGWGLAGGLAGGELGRRGTALAGSALQGVQNDAAAYLRSQGVPLTYGQIRGGAAKAREDRLAGFGGVGDKIMDRRREGLFGFNRAAFREGGETIAQGGVGDIGEQGIDTMRGMVSGPGGAYDRALNGVTLVPDHQFGSDVAAALAQGQSLPRVGPEFQAFVGRSIAPHFSAPNGQLDGRQVQDILQQVRGADFGTDSMGSMASDALRSIEGALMDLADRQAPGAMDALGRANTAYRNLNILADAVGKGANTGGIFTPAQLGAAARSNATKFGGKIAAATPDRPFFDLQRAGQDVLPSKIPDSGTAGRTEQNMGISALLRSGVRNAVNAPLYAESTQDLIARLLMDRPGAVARVGRTLEDKANIAALLTRPLALTKGPVAVVPDY